MASTGLRVVNRHHVALDFNWTTVQDFALWRALHEVASTARGDVMCGIAFTHYRVVDGEMLPVVTRMGPYTVVDSDISETLDEGYSMVRLAGAVDFDPNASDSSDDSVDNDLDLFTAVSPDPVGEGSRRVDLEWVAAANADDVFRWRDLLIYGPNGQLDPGRLGDNDDVYVEHGRDIHGLSEYAHFTLDFYSIDILDESSPADRDALATRTPGCYKLALGELAAHLPGVVAATGTCVFCLQAIGADDAVFVVVHGNAGVHFGHYACFMPRVAVDNKCWCNLDIECANERGVGCVIL